MRKRSLLFISLLLCLSLAACKGKGAEEKGALEKGDMAADIKFLDVEGKSVSLSQFKGKVVMLNFWATWCPPCREEMPSMEALYEKFGKVEAAQKAGTEKEVTKDEKKANNKTFAVSTSEGKKTAEGDFVMLLVSIDENIETVTEFIKKNNYRMPVYHDPNKEAGSVYGITGVPETFIIDKNGKIAEKVIGPIDWMKPEVLKFIEDLKK